MSLMRIVHPLPFVVVPGDSSAGSGLANVATVSPREAFVTAADPAVIAIDLGAEVSVDTFFVGFTSAGAGAVLTVRRGTGGREVIGEAPFAHSYRRNPLRHAVLLGQPVVGRYFELRVSGAPQLAVGVVAVGRAIRPGEDAGLAASFEMGAGRPIADPSRVERLMTGAFAIQRGVAANGFSCTLPGLSDVEADRLHALQLDVGIGGSVLAIEDELGGAGFNERIHWGLLARLEPAARQAPGETKLAFQMQDWA